MDVSKNRGTPKRIVKIMENPIEMDDLGYHYFWKHPYERYVIDEKKSASIRKTQFHVPPARSSVKSMRQDDLGERPATVATDACWPSRIPHVFMAAFWGWWTSEKENEHWVLAGFFEIDYFVKSRHSWKEIPCPNHHFSIRMKNPGVNVL